MYWRKIDKVADRIFVFLLMLNAASICWPRLINNVFIILLVLNWLLLPNLKDRIHKCFVDRKILFFIGFFALYFISFLYANDVSKGLSQVEKRLSYLVFPIILGTVQLKDKEIKKILFGFVLSYLLTSAFLLIYGVMNFLEQGNYEVFFYKNLTSLVRVHVVYYAMYGIFCIGILTYLFGRKWGNLSSSQRIILLAAYLFCVFIIVLCASKMMITIGMLMLSASIYYSFNNQINFRLLAGGIVSILLVVLLSFQFNVVKQRFSDLLDTDFSVLRKERLKDLKGPRDPEKHVTIADPINGLNLRLLLWKIGLESIIQDNHIFMGVGPADYQGYLNQQYIEYNLDRRTLLGYDQHNQYMATLVSLGVVGLAYLLLLFILSVRKAFSTKNLMYFIFLTTFMLGCISESMLLLNKGIVYFTFFNCLLFFSLENFSLLKPEVRNEKR
ncbi:O-antigen ligase family protein [Xanthovirga aplysinae]|uniref:O-antigen ligase family protein n=1 Tax=Xanthovirga aplysinae TaxID=2529853 RepID=UPI0012BB6B9D|nr:O-antigen ligase family protein [Xanthovirga aplysinae]MTI30974.1 hypothetical protein [Xanthovirga aplysinae]